MAPSIPRNHQAKVSDVKSLDAKNRVDVMKDQSGNVKDYNWSLKPLVMWMILIGIFPPLQNSNKRSQFAELKKILSMVFRISTWLATGSIQLYLVYAVLFGNPNSFFVAAKYKSTAKWNNMFFYTSHMLHAIGIHSFLLISFNKQWKNLQASLESTETQQLKRPIPYANLRKWCLYGFVYIFITEGTWTLMKGLDFATTTLTDVPASRVVTQILACCSKLYTTTIRVLFCLACKMIIEQLKCIEYQIDYMSSKAAIEEQHQDDLLSDQLFKLQCRYAQISRSRNCLNGCFGFILLFDVSFNIFGVVNETMNFIFNGFGGSLGSCAFRAFVLITAVKHILSLILIIFQVDALNDMAEKLQNSLYALLNERKPNRPIRGDIESFLHQVWELNPKVNAAGFFTVGKELLPALIGTVLTYILVMLQFYESEPTTAK